MSALPVPTRGIPAAPGHPSMRVAKTFDASSATLGLERPVPLLGGGTPQLPSGLPIAVWSEHQPDLSRAVAHACRSQAQAGRGWHAHGCIAMAGPSGSGRGHAARLLAGAAGLPLFVADASTPQGRAALRGDPEPGCAALVPTALGAVAASRCANPVVLVEGLREDEDFENLLGAFLDPDRSPRFRSTALGATFDLSQVNWILQVASEDAAARLPEGWASVVRVERPQGDARRALDISIAQALRDGFGGPFRADASAAVAYALDPGRPARTIAKAAEEMAMLVAPIDPPVPVPNTHASIWSEGQPCRTGRLDEPMAAVIDAEGGSGTGIASIVVASTVVASPAVDVAATGGPVPRGTLPHRFRADDAAGATTIVVNGREHRFGGDRIGHGDLARLAFPMLSERDGRALAASWSCGPAPGERGVLAFGRSVEVREGQRFHVVVTDKS